MPAGWARARFWDAAVANPSAPRLPSVEQDRRLFANSSVSDAARGLARGLPLPTGVCIARVCAGFPQIPFATFNTKSYD